MNAGSSLSNQLSLSMPSKNELNSSRLVRSLFTPYLSGNQELVDQVPDNVSIAFESVSQAFDFFQVALFIAHNVPDV